MFAAVRLGCCTVAARRGSFSRRLAQAGGLVHAAVSTSERPPPTSPRNRRAIALSHWSCWTRWTAVIAVSKYDTISWCLTSLTCPSRRPRSSLAMPAALWWGTKFGVGSWGSVARDGYDLTLHSVPNKSLQLTAYSIRLFLRTEKSVSPGYTDGPGRISCSIALARRPSARHRPCRL
jgi:hypothetical protein